MLRIAAWCLAAGLLLWLLDRLALQAERRGWIYYRRKRARPGSVGNALLAAHALLEPRVEALVEARAEAAPEAEESGEPAEDPKTEAPEPRGGEV
ncbi:MAG: hypothetical protein M5U13_02160 [Thermoanaerobaculia bacterium]|nr:hypothetical protein [Thermoanaerobaculia bacterium]